MAERGCHSAAAQRLPSGAYCRGPKPRSHPPASFPSPSHRFIVTSLPLPATPSSLLHHDQRGEPQKQAPTEQAEGKYAEAIEGVVTLPQAEVKEKRYGETERGQVNKATFVRVDYAGNLEEAINRQIDFEMNLGYVFLARGAYFDRDTVALPGISKFFRCMSESEFGDGEKFAAFQNMRGGRVQLMALPMRDSDYYNAEKGDALYAFDLALALQKLNMDKLKACHSLADKSDDFQAQDFLEDEMSAQAKLVKQLGDYVCELKRVGKGHGVFHFDERIDEGGLTAAA